MATAQTSEGGMALEPNNTVS